jgi:endo-1,3(4)-beta-glucanase
MYADFHGSGHSWAKGLFESADGKDEESTSEVNYQFSNPVNIHSMAVQRFTNISTKDVFSAYAIKMWGNVIGDNAMEGRGNLMLSILARTLPSYFLMESTNPNQPPQFLKNKVTGILFENKCDHATYFGMNTEYIQGYVLLDFIIRVLLQ